MLNKTRVLQLLGMSALATACTTSLETKIEPYNATTIRDGLTYRLPVAEIDMTITRVLTKCDFVEVTFASDRETITKAVDHNGNILRLKKDEVVRVSTLNEKIRAETTVPQPQDLEDLIDFKFEFKVSLAHKVDYVDGELLSIDPEQMADTFKTSSVDVAYHKGTQTISMFNGTIEGKEAEATAAGIKLAASVASAAFGLPLPVAVGTATDQGEDGKPATKFVSLCSDKAIEATKAYASTNSKLSAWTTRATNLASHIESLKKRKEAGTASADDLKDLTKFTADAKKLAGYIKAAQTEKARLLKILGTINSRSDFRKDRLSVNNDGTIGVPYFDDFPTDQKRKDWLDELIPTHSNSEILDEIVRQITVYGTLVPIDNEYKCTSDCVLSPPSSDGADDFAPETYGGLLYRIPLSALLIISTEPVIDRISSASAQTKRKKDLSFETVRIPQYGPLRSLQLKSDWGEKNNLTVSFDEAGLPTAIAYKRENAPGVAALSAADQAVQAYLGLRDQADAKNTADAAALVAEEQAEIDALARQIDLLTKQRELEQLTIDPNQEMVDLQAELARLTLLASIKAQQDILDGVAVDGDDGS